MLAFQRLYHSSILSVTLYQYTIHDTMYYNILKLWFGIFFKHNTFLHVELEMLLENSTPLLQSESRRESLSNKIIVLASVFRKVASNFVSTGDKNSYDYNLRTRYDMLCIKFNTIKIH